MHMAQLLDYKCLILVVRFLVIPDIKKGSKEGALVLQRSMAGADPDVHGFIGKGDWQSTT